MLKKDNPSTELFSNPIDKTLEEFYYYLENKHRSSEQLIKDRLRFYEPLFEFLKKNFEKPRAIDLGCGRGELLELLSDHGIYAEGVESNERFVNYARSKGLNVVVSGALQYLSSKEAQSFHLVSLRHLIEHLEPNYIFALFKEVFRVLTPGGILIVETPYTKNIVSGAYNFWLDPTHKRPIPVEFIQTLGEFLGFSHSSYFPLQSLKLTSIQEVTIHDIFYTTFPDVSIILVKGDSLTNNHKEIETLFQKLRQNATVDYLDILNLYEQSTQKKFQELLRQTDELWKQLYELKQDLSSTLKTNEFNRHLEEIRHELHHISTIAHESLRLVNFFFNTKLWRTYDKLGQIKRFLIRNIKNILNIKKFLKKIYPNHYSPSPSPSNIELEPNIELERDFLINRLKFWSDQR
ncbi:MAG: class I SAM-dependent methyltransferase [Desulfurococcaceae archaeon]